MSYIVNEPSNPAVLEKERRELMLKQDYTTTRDLIYISPYELYAEPITITPSNNSFDLNTESSKCTNTWFYKWCSNFCACYRKDSNDTRCGGICYRLCPSEKTNNMRCEICTNGFWDHCRSSYIYTDDAGCNNEDEDDSAGLYCIICFPFKLGIFSPCLLGSLFNSCVNTICKTNTNYLF